MNLADNAALRIMADDVLSPKVVTRAIDKLMAKFEQPAEDVQPRRDELAATLRATERELARLTAAVARGDAPDGEGAPATV